MHDSIATPEQRTQFLRITYISDNQFKSLRQLFVPSGKVVVDDDFVSFAAKHMGSVATDVPRPSNYQNGQVSSRCNSASMIVEGQIVEGQKNPTLRAA